ncbi:MAG: hypothetical protein MK132_21500 [Lentisphaerales bacterium]|nr:hypothetical protein [Lentisphaerales bacterium]
MKKLLLLLLLPLQVFTQEMIIIRGANGTEDYKDSLDESLTHWQHAAQKAKITPTVFHENNSKEQFFQHLKALPKKDHHALWIIFLGHGTYLNGEAKLNLNGDDISANELKSALNLFSREIIFINTASTSAPFLSALSFPGRVIITATKNAQQIYYTKFNEFMSLAIAAPEADIDKDGQTSLLESFLSACQHTEAFYKQENRLRGEDALIDDNGDQLGSSLKHYDGLMPKKPSEKIDGFRAGQIHLVKSPEEAALLPKQRQTRDLLEQKLYRLRLLKSSLPEDDYYQKLEVILREIAAIYQDK